MINPATFLNKPVYLFNPSQIWSRCFKPRLGVAEVQTAWGEKILCNTNEQIGKDLHDKGIYDLVVSEVIYRLMPSGGLGVDVGANIGHMTGLMAKKAGSSGQVVSFEPSSRIRETLSRNVGYWTKSNSTFAKIAISGKAVSAAEGRAQIYYPAQFSSNEGIASLDPGWSGGCSGDREEVETTTLDKEFGENQDVISVLKVDVEGHELSVFKGAQRLLADRKITNIVFEDLQGHGPAGTYLAGFGYEIFRLSRSLTRVRLCSVGGCSSYPVDVLPNFLATVNPQTAEAKFSKRGWMTLRS
jgi:FkbM family methyltransferase